MGVRRQSGPARGQGGHSTSRRAGVWPIRDLRAGRHGQLAGLHPERGGGVARRYHLSYEMGLGHERFDEELGALASDYRYSESNHRGFYRRWAQLMADA